ncbi:hypothetical protein ACEQPO_23515 [Bacillus sp. SL00103]
MLHFGRRNCQQDQQNDSLPSEKELWHDFEQKINILLEEDVPVVSFTFSCPNEQTIHRLKQKGIFFNRNRHNKRGSAAFRGKRDGCHCTARK